MSRRGLIAPEPKVTPKGVWWLCVFGDSDSDENVYVHKMLVRAPNAHVAKRKAQRHAILGGALWTDVPLSGWLACGPEDDDIEVVE